MTTCDWQPVIAGLGLLLTLAAPGVAALLVALSTRSTVAKMPGKRATDQQSKGGPDGRS